MDKIFTETDSKKLSKSDTKKLTETEKLTETDSKKLSKSDTKKLTETEKLSESDTKKLTETDSKKLIHIVFTKKLSKTDIVHRLPFPTQSLQAFAFPIREHSKEIGAKNLQAGQRSHKKGVSKKKMTSSSS